MAKNQVYKEADFLSLPVPTGKLSGQPVRIGGLNGVLLTNEGSVDKGPNDYDKAASSNEPGFASVALKGAFMIPVSTTTALTVGAPVYIITATGVLTTTDNSAANPLFGHALSAKGTTANQPVIVRLSN
jgi:predicted RecA/RadA family phage recombinase